MLLRKRVKKVQKQLRNLEKEKWIDYQTRAIIIEFSIYNVQASIRILHAQHPGWLP